jgi:hypothetical protein
MNSGMRADRRWGRRSAIWLAGIGTALAGTAVLVIAATSAASGSPTSIPHAKLVRIEAQQARVAKSKAEHKATLSYAAGLKAAQAANGPAQTRSAGIVDMHQGPFSAASFDVQNVYQGPANGTWLLVYSGATINPNTGAVATGALNIYAEPQVGGLMTFVGVFQAPAGTPALTITAASGERLTLRTSHGNELTFNLAPGKFTA